MSAIDQFTNVIRLPVAEQGNAARIITTAYAAPFAPRRLATLNDIDYIQEYDGGIYRDLDVELTLDYMRRRFVVPVSRHVDIANSTLLDCAAGFGWLAFAYVLAGGKRATLVEPDERRLEAARDIAQRLGIEQRCQFIAAHIQDIDLEDDGIDIFTTIETLEHVGRANIAACVSNIARIARQAVILTAPNFLFPVVAHDTDLLFAHWLPEALRRRYAAARGRARFDHGNQFPLPWDLAPLMAKFRPSSRYQTFATRQDYDRFYPHYMPYGPSEAKRYRTSPRRGQRPLQIALSAVLGRYSFMLAPNLASMWLRRQRG